MIIKNVIVYTEDKKFTAGGIVVHDDKIESIYTTENVPDMPWKCRSISPGMA